MKRILTLLCLLLGFNGTQYAQIKLPALVRDSMILQRDKTVKIWGWATPDEKISLRFNGKQYRSKADAQGNWAIALPPVKAGGPYTMEISGKNTIRLKDILFGDVWFCSGQSNMVHQLNIHDVTYAKDISEANYPMIRQFWIPTRTNMQRPETNFPEGYWVPAVGAAVRPFSAVAFFFARKLYEAHKIPIGIINASVGGTPIQAWISEEGLKTFPAAVEAIARNRDTSLLNNQRRRAAAGSRNPPPPSPADAGITENIKWYEPSYAPKGWRSIAVPGYWEDQGIRDLNGIVWYRKEIDIPASMVGKEAKVFLGRIVDADELYINGTKVGSTGYQYPQRRYKVQSGVLKEGKNIFVVRVTNNSGKGGFVPDKPYCIFSGTDTVPLYGYWQYKVGAVFRPAQGGFGGGGVNAQNQPAALYNAMVAPSNPYAIKGICWYQGESDSGQPGMYVKWQQAIIKDWRTQRNDETLPFLYVQLPGYMDYNYLPSESNWALMREAQAAALELRNTGMAVAIDLGEWNDIHPDNKKDVGERLALAAEKIAYGKDIVYSGPMFRSAQIEGDKIRISFQHTGSGLTTSDGEAPAEFAIAGADKKFVWAKAKIEGNEVVVWSPEIKEPEYVRYAWADNPVNPSLVNKEGLPAAPFRTDK
ncbi:MAG: sialate O-acetylesterase [Chitinophagaceae bacterium]